MSGGTGSLRRECPVAQQRFDLGVVRALGMGPKVLHAQVQIQEIPKEMAIRLVPARHTYPHFQKIPRI